MRSNRMFRLNVAPISILFALFLPCAAQTPDVPRANAGVKELELSLTSGKPLEVAWAAYTIAREKRRQLIPNLIALVDSYREVSFPESTVPPEVAAIEAVADALIQLHADLPAETIMHLYPQLPAQTIILLSRASDNTAPLLEIFRTTPYRDLWLAAGDLLAVHPPPGFTRALIQGFTASFVFQVVTPPDQPYRSVGEGGCASDSFMTRADAFIDWPKTRMYALMTHGLALNVFAPVSIQLVSVIGRPPTTGMRGPTATASQRQAWIGVPASSRNCKGRIWTTSLKPEIKKAVRYISAELFQDRVKAAIDEQSQALTNVLESLVQAGSLSVQDSMEIHLQCRIEIQDKRPQPRAPLPEIEGKWCKIAPPAPRMG
jgi:hypothetical protein